MVLTELRDDHIRYVRLCVLVIVKGREALVNFLEKSLHKHYGRSKAFANFLNESQVKRTLSDMESFTPEHRNLLYPENNPMIKDSAGEWLGDANPSVTTKDLDINALYIFLRYFCELMSPERNIWRNPWPGDNRPEACISRIRVYRNKLAYNNACTISQREFDELWNDRVSDVGTLSQLYAPDYYKALATVQIVIYPNKNQLDKILQAMRKMYHSVDDEIRDLEVELDRLFESLSLSQAPKLVQVLDSIRKKDRPKERKQKIIPKKSKWNKIKLATLEQIEDGVKQTTLTPTRSDPKPPPVEVRKSTFSPPIVEVHPPPPVEPEFIVEQTAPEKTFADNDNASNQGFTNETSFAANNNVDYMFSTENTYTDTGNVDYSENVVEKTASDDTPEPAIDIFRSTDRDPLVAERDDEVDEEDSKSRRKPFKLASVLRDMMKVRDELDHNHKKIGSILRRTSSEEGRDSLPNGNTTPVAPGKSETFENAATLPLASRENTVPTRKKRLGAMGKASGVGQLLRQIHTSGMKLAVSSDESPVLERKEMNTDKGAVTHTSKAEKNDSSSDEDQWDSEDATNFLSRDPRHRSSGMGTDVMFMSSSMSDNNRRQGGYGRNSFGFAMGPGMYHQGFRPGVHSGGMYHGAYARGPGSRLRVERKGTKYRARSSGHAGRMRRGGRGGLI